MRPSQLPLEQVWLANPTTEYIKQLMVDLFQLTILESSACGVLAMCMSTERHGCRCVPWRTARITAGRKQRPSQDVARDNILQGPPHKDLHHPLRPHVPEIPEAPKIVTPTWEGAERSEHGPIEMRCILITILEKDSC